MREIDITKGIVQYHVRDLMKYVSSDVVIVGAGPSGLVGAGLLAERGRRVAILEKRLSPGGGIWGGGMGYTYVITQEEARHILDAFEIPYERVSAEFLAVDAVALASGLIFGAVKRGAKLFNLTTVEDLMVSDGRVRGVVINNSFAVMNHFPIDPLTLETRAVVDATGHEHDVVQTFSKKNDVAIDTPTGKPLGERSLFAEPAERAVVENTRQVYPGLYVCGMSTASVYGGYRMGPIFGGMLLSGERLAELIDANLA
ncbi:MAG: sulfide-dependent adenosine diphosphate thiazole synthase [Deltaproteobacteria bacterium]